MSLEHPIKKFFIGYGNVNYAGPFSGRVPPIAGANNGVSIDAVSNNVVLGNNVGATVGQLISNREIPFNTFSLAFTQIGKSLTSFPVFRSDATRILTTPIWQVQDSTSTSICDFRTPDNNTIGIGFEALLSNPSLNQQSVAIGRGTLRNTTGTSIRNIAIGQQAMQNNINTATLCVAIASFALFNVTGANNIAIGHNAGVNVRAGTDNTYMGVGTGGKNQTGNFNVAIGNNALAESLVATTNNSQNVAIGWGCCQQSNPGDNNVYAGYKNCFNITAGNNNVSIGGNSFINAATIGASNVYIGGTQAITGVASAGANNIWIGANITIATAGITNATLVGQGMSTTISNIATLGRLDQNVLIGFTATTVDNGSRLQINGSVTTTQPSANGAGAWLLGKVVVAAVALDATRYIETSVDGTIRKFLVGV